MNTTSQPELQGELFTLVGRRRRLTAYHGDQATARNSDPETSKAAASEFTEQRLTQIQQDVLDWFRTVGQGTDEELEDALGILHPGFSTLRKRRTELFQKGVLEDSGERQKNRNGRKMIVWRVKA